MLLEPHFAETPLVQMVTEEEPERALDRLITDRSAAIAVPAVSSDQVRKDDPVKR